MKANDAARARGGRWRAGSWTGVRALLLVGAVSFSSPVAAGGGSYRKLDGEGDVARYYATRGEAFVGRSLHLHVPRAVFRKEVSPEKRRTTSRNLEFADRGVAVLVSPSNPYYRQFLRKKASGGKACVKGRVERRSGTDGAPVAVLLVETVSAAGDDHPGSTGGKKKSK